MAADRQRGPAGAHAGIDRLDAGGQRARSPLRLVQGGRSTIIPITVSGDVVGALVVGPMADEPGFSTIVKVRDLVNETASRLTEAWRTKR